MYNTIDIMKILPHRYPFLLVDKILFVKEGESATGIKNITISDPVFQGHFPDEPIYPGVLLVEAMAQVGAVALLSKDEYKGKKAYFTRIKNVKFIRPVLPGDTVVFTTTLTTMRLHIGFARGIAKVGDQVVCQGEIAFSLGSL